VADVQPPEEQPEEQPPVSAEDGGRRYPSTIGGAFYLAVLAVVAISLGITSSGNWRLGVRWFGGALIFAALVRVVLPERDAGMLAVRRRWWDCLLLAGVGVALVLLASSVPDQPGL
jgi:hypothetical protein